MTRKVFSIVTSEMCDRVIPTLEPEPGGELGPETDTGSGVSCQYSIIGDIGVTQQSQTEKLTEFSFDAYGQLVVRDPGFSDQRGAGLSHTRETGTQHLHSPHHRGRGHHVQGGY